MVDDDIAHRAMLRIVLNWNYEIFEADDGLVAIEKILDDSFDFDQSRQTIERAVAH